MSGGSADPQWAPGFAAWTLRTRSTDALRLLEEWAREDPVAWGPAHARCLALLPDADPTTALRAFARVPTGTLERADAFLHAQLLLRAGDRPGVDRVLGTGLLSTPEAWSLRTDLANPFAVDGALGDVDGWLARLNEPFVAAGLEPLVLDDTLTGPEAAPFTWLRARPTARVDASDVVTVVVSTYRPGPDLLTAVRSLIDQSWPALEILLVDDASGAGHDAVLDQAAALDDRIRIVRAERNGGTYAARNLALTLATGRYVTFHDFDDWAHPRRVERQVAALDGGRLASRSGCLRAYPDLSLTYPGYGSERLNASSLLIERHPATELVGGFDLVRKSADMEYPGRLRAARPGALKDLPVAVPLAVTQLRHGSLSRSDAVPGWTRWNRIAYRDGYREWHRRISTGSASPWLPLHHAAGSPSGVAPPTRTFSAHGDVGPAPGEHLDVVLLADLRTDHATLRRAAAELSTLASSGLTVGVAHLDPPVRPRPKVGTFDRAVAHLLNDGVVRWADPDEAMSVGTVLVLDPPTLMLREPRPVAWSVGRTLLHVRSAKDLVADVPAGVGPADPARLAAAAVFALGAPVQWRALSGDGAGLVARHSLDGPGHLPWVVAPASSAREPGSERVRVGHGVLCPDPWDVGPEDLLAWFGDGPGLDVRFAHGARAAERTIAGPPPPEWLFLDEVDAASDPFFATSLDVMTAPAVCPDTVAAAREALAAGAVVALPASGRAVVEREDPELVALVVWLVAPLGPAEAVRLAQTDTLPSRTALAGLAAARIRTLLPETPGG